MKFTYTKSEKLCPSVELYALSTIILSSSSFSESIGTKSHMEVQDQGPKCHLIDRYSIWRN